MYGSSNILASSHATMNTAVHSLSSTPVYVHGGQQQPRFVSLTTHESIRKAMQHTQDQPPTSVGAASAFGQHTATTTSSRAARPSQLPMTWPASTLPHLPISPQPRPQTDYFPEHESAPSPLSQRSRQSTVVQSPDTGAFS